MRRVIVAAGLVSAIVMVFGAGCAGKHLKSDEAFEGQRGIRIGEKAKIRDKKKVREALDVVAQYQQAVAKKDFGTLKRLIADDYYDNAGTTDTTTDDYGGSKLPGIFEMMAKHADEIKFTVIVKRVQFKHERALIDYEYEYAYKYKVGDKPTWDAGVEVNRLELVPTNGKWRIASGL
mgnify:CR=1 FL=1